MGTHMPYGITQCYLSPDRGNIPDLTPAEAGTQFSDPGGCKVELFGKIDSDSLVWLMTPYLCFYLLFTKTTTAHLTAFWGTAQASC